MAGARRRPVELADEPGHGTFAWTSPHRTRPDRPSRWPTRSPCSTGGAAGSSTPGRRPRDRLGAGRHRGHPLRRPGRHRRRPSAGSGSTPRSRRLALEPRGRASRPCAPSPRRSGGVGSTSRATGGTGTPSWRRLPELLAAKLRRPVGRRRAVYDLVIDPTNLWLTIHESIGHATELDRALGYEAAYAGTSFATFDKLGSLRYGSEVMHVTGDRTTHHGLATVGHRRRGRAGPSPSTWSATGCSSGTSSTGPSPPPAGSGASNGCAFADSPLHVPIQRMANVSLQPAPGRVRPPRS